LEEVKQLKTGGIALGINRQIELREASIDLLPGDTLVLYTDGITEAINDRNELFGLERLVQTIRSNGTLSSKDLIEKIQNDVMRFADGKAQFDDITLMVLKIA
jgi:serine phosphatase RsbU (regulator of sigma subunit)